MVDTIVKSEDHALAYNFERSLRQGKVPPNPNSLFIQEWTMRFSEFRSNVLNEIKKWEIMRNSNLY